VIHRGEGMMNDPPADANHGRARSDFLEILQNRVDHFEGLINLLPYFRTGQDNLAANEDE